MIAQTDWSHVHFHDAIVRRIEHGAVRLEFGLSDVALLPGHPDNSLGDARFIPNASLIFECPRDVVIREWDADNQQWKILVPLDGMINSIADVSIDETERRWTVKGFAEDGRWVEWQVDEGVPARLEIFRDLEVGR